MTPANFERSLKRLVRGPSWTWMGVCTPGFEEVLARELQSAGFDPLIESTGTVSWEGRIQDCIPVLMALRTCNRVYLRLASFRAGAREELFRKTLDVPWELWLHPTTMPMVQSHVRRSRLSHEGQSSRTIEEAIRRRLAESGADASLYADLPALPEARILARVEDNMVQISLDASGDLHYRRGFRPQGALAPLRESLGTALLLRSFPDMDWTRAVFWDAMCGSGTMAVEALSLMSGARVGAGRSFAFASWPGSSQKTIAWAGKTTTGAADPQAGLRLGASDMDPLALGQTAESLARAGDAWGLAVPGPQKADFFALEPPFADHEGPRVLFLNPPYGRRLADDTRLLYAGLARTLRERWGAWHVVLIVPEEELLDLFPSDAGRFSFRHGGLRVWCLFRRPGKA